MEQGKLNLETMNKEIIALKQEMEKIKDSIKEDLEFSIKTELAWQEIDAGKGIKTSVEDFFKDLRKR